jgi:hypothetical protein
LEGFHHGYHSHHVGTHQQSPIGLGTILQELRELHWDPSGPSLF